MSIFEPAYLKNMTIINEGHAFVGTVMLTCGRIQAIIPQKENVNIAESNGILIPGVIDTHVHFREPGLTEKGDIVSESRAAAAGGVTTYFDMPNCQPTTTTPREWVKKTATAENKSRVNFACFFGATNDNADELKRLDKRRVPGIKLFMGASTGNMLVDNKETLRNIFQSSSLPIVAHCEDSDIINANAHRYRSLLGNDIPIKYHPLIRSEEACVRSTALAIRMAQETGARLHIAHVSTARELQMIAEAGDNVTAEACLSHLLFCDEDYSRLGSRIKCNPAIKTRADRDALRRALNDGTITTVATDHAPHLLKDKEGGCLEAASGIPMVQYSLPAMLTLADEGILSYERVVELMCHAPARLFGIQWRGFIREGYYADFVYVKRTKHTVNKDDIISKCGWSPLEGRTLNWRVGMTLCNGKCVYNTNEITNAAGKTIFYDQIDDDVRGQAVTFSR